jgi:ABC-type lipoprotein export system ATPase subunit
MIELFGIGVHDRGIWRLRRLCLRLEERGLIAVLSESRDERTTLLEVLAGRRVPSEGRAWINGTPLSADTAPRIRQRVGVIDLTVPPTLNRMAAWQTLRERVGLAVDARRLTAEPDGWDRTRLAVARALRNNLDHVIVVEPDAHFDHDDVVRLLGYLRGLASRDRLRVLVSLADRELAGEADTALTIIGGGVIPRAPALRSRSTRRCPPPIPIA